MSLEDEVARAKAKGGRGPMGITGVIHMLVNRSARLGRRGLPPHIDIEDVEQETYCELLARERREPLDKASGGAGVCRMGGLIAYRYCGRLLRQRIPESIDAPGDDAPGDDAPAHAALATPARDVPEADEETAAKVLRAWKSLMARLESANREWEKRCLRAIVAHGGSHHKAARSLNTTPKHVRRGLAAALSYPEGAELRNIWDNWIAPP